MTGYRRNKLITIFTGIVVLYIFVFFPYFGFFRKLIKFAELKAYDIDTRFIRGVKKPTSNIIIVAIDDVSFNELGIFPWPRDFHAKLIKILKAHGAKIICLDIDFSTPASAGLKSDLILANESKKAGNVVIVNTFTVIKDQNFTAVFPNYPINILKNNTLSYGFSNLDTDQDNAVRYYRLRREHQGNIYHSFAVEILAKYLKIESEDLFAKIPHKFNESILINYCGPTRTFKNISYYEVLEEKFPENFFKDKIVLVGATSDILHDIHYTPFGKLSGVEIHANAIDTILSEDFLYKTDELTNKFIVSIIGLIVIILALLFNPLISFLIISVLLILVEISFSYIFSYHNLWIDTITPVVSTFFVYSVVTVVGYFTEGIEKKKIKNIFKRYVTSDVVDEIIEHSDKIFLGGKMIPVTILFSDIRGFTGLTEKLNPEDVVKMLNEYLGEMTDVILEYKGTIDKFIGDAILAVFSVPLPKDDDTVRAVKVAINMRSRLEILNKKWKEIGKETLNIGIGLDYGEVIAGNIGSKDRMEYTIIGDAVNTASRLQSLTKELHKDIIISDRVYERVKELIYAEPIGEYPLRGKSEPVFIYELKSLKI